MTRAFLVAILLLSLDASLVEADVDWRTKGAVTPVKNQGDSICNFSWAFAVAGVYEGARFLRTSSLVSLSEQELIDCAHCGGSLGAAQCAGSVCPQLGCVFDFLQMNGLCGASSYPFTGRVGTCKECIAAAKITGNWRRLEGESALVGALATDGPILARLDVGVNGRTLPAYLNYHGGVFIPGPTDATVVQWVVLVGYTANYFIVKNSLGTGWGANGYLYLARGGNYLGVNNFAYALGVAPTQAACTLPDGSCLETSPTDCAAANGISGAIGTFCATPCPGSAARATPMLSTGITVGLAVLLAAMGLGSLRRALRMQ